MKNNVKNFIKRNLIKFTGLPKQTIEKYIEREESLPNHIKEWNFWNPQTPEEINWNYVCSRTYLFNTARHVLLDYVYNEIKPESIIFDFGGGCGYASIPLAKNKNCEIYYFDINLIQREFVRFIIEKYKLKIHILDNNEYYMPILSKEIRVDYVFAFDVFEHIPDYPKYIKLLSKTMKIGAKIYIIAPFDNLEPSHMLDMYGLDEVCRKNGLGKKSKLGKTTIFYRIK